MMYYYFFIGVSFELLCESGEIPESVQEGLRYWNDSM